MLSVARAGLVGLIANELVTNALKHTFPEDRAGTISIGLRREGPDFLLTVAEWDRAAGDDA
jgi:two-component sensor histidine kinase